MSILVNRNIGTQSRTKSIMLGLALVTLVACAPSEELLKKLNDSISYGSYAKCSVTYEKGRDIAGGSLGIKSLALASIYFNKAIALSSKDAAAKKADESKAYYDKLQKESSEAAYLDVLIRDTKKCNSYALKQ